MITRLQGPLHARTTHNVFDSTTCQLNWRWANLSLCICRFLSNRECFSFACVFYIYSFFLLNLTVICPAGDEVVFICLCLSLCFVSLFCSLLSSYNQHKLAVHIVRLAFALAFSGHSNSCNVTQQAHAIGLCVIIVPKGLHQSHSNTKRKALQQMSFHPLIMLQLSCESALLNYKPAEN